MPNRLLNLPWFTYNTKLLSQLGLQSDANSKDIRSKAGEIFEGMWEVTATSSSKLSFYTRCKTNIKEEPYLRIRNPEKRRNLARLRASSHRLNVELGRYSQNNKGDPYNTLWLKCCNTCCGDAKEYLLNLPFASEPTIEDEYHVLVCCPRYDDIRGKLSDQLKATLSSWNVNDSNSLASLFEDPLLHEFSSYVTNIFNIRFPKSSSDKPRKKQKKKDPHKTSKDAKR